MQLIEAVINLLPTLGTKSLNKTPRNSTRGFVFKRCYIITIIVSIKVKCAVEERQ